MEVRKNDKIRYTKNGVEKEGIVTNVCLNLDVYRTEVEVMNFFGDSIEYISKKDITLITREARENTRKLVINELYEKPNEKFVRVYFMNGQRKESIAPLRLFVKFYYDDDKKDFCMEVNGAKNPYPFRKAYGINPNMVEKCLKEMGWNKINTRYWSE